MKNIAYLFTLNLILCSNSSSAQWNTQSFMDTYIGNGYYGTYVDVGFMSPEVGMYSYSYYWSPSSGTSYYGKISTDSCQTWTTGSSGYYFSLPQQKTIYAWGVNNGFTSIVKFYNQGLNYYAHPPFNAYTMDVHGPDTANIYVLCSGQLKKLNGTFFPTNLAQIIGFNAYRLFFTDTLNGYILGDSSTASMHSILKTTNGGITFTNCFTDTSFFIRDVYFVNNLLGYAVGNNGKAIKTIDGGVSWQNLITGVSSNLTSVRFVNSILGFVGGNGGLMLRSNDGGVTYTQDSINSTNTINKIVFVNDTLGYAADGSYIYMINLIPTGLNVLPNKYENSIILYPNPNSGIFSIKAPDAIKTFKDAWLYVYDNTGKETARFSLDKESDTPHFNISKTAKGTYTVKLMQESKTYIGQMIVE